jgi:hypothetical protein
MSGLQMWSMGTRSLSMPPKSLLFHLSCQSSHPCDVTHNESCILFPTDTCYTVASHSLLCGEDTGTYIFAPAVGSDDLVLLINIQYLNQLQSEEDLQRFICAPHRPTHATAAVIPVQQMLDEPLLIRHCAHCMSHACHMWRW